ncbi:serine hydrolase [Desulfococcaceae bacterium HSG8]|nr:serine hydrolase [Desulfococcaceae bacterium HSG8]
MNLKDTSGLNDKFSDESDKGGKTASSRRDFLFSLSFLIGSLGIGVGAKFLSFSAHGHQEVVRHDVTYIQGPDLESVLDYKEDVEKFLSKEVRKSLRIVKKGENFGLVCRLNLDEKSAVQVAEEHCNILNENGLNGAIPIRNDEYELLHNVDYFTGPDLDVVKKHYARVYSVLSDEIGKDFVVEKNRKNGYSLIYKCLEKEDTARLIAQKHLTFLEANNIGLTISPVVDQNYKIIYEESDFLAGNAEDDSLEFEADEESEYFLARNKKVGTPGIRETVKNAPGNTSQTPAEIGKTVTGLVPADGNKKSSESKKSDETSPPVLAYKTSRTPEVKKAVKAAVDKKEEKSPESKKSHKTSPVLAYNTSRPFKVKKTAKIKVDHKEKKSPEVKKPVMKTPVSTENRARKSSGKLIDNKNLSGFRIKKPGYEKRTNIHRSDAELERKIESYINRLRRKGWISSDEKTAWSVYDFTLEEKLVSINEEIPYQTASMVKPFIALAFFSMLEEKRGRFRYTKKNRRRMEAMIRRSSNSATNYFIRMISKNPRGVERILKRKYPHIFKETKIVELIPPSGRTYRNKASARDYSRFLYALWHDRFPYSREIKRVMRLPNRDRIYRGAKKIPPGTLVYDKTGTTAKLCGNMGILSPKGRDGKRYPYTLIGIIERPSRARNYPRWSASRGNVIREVSNIVYSDLKKRHNL